MASLQDAVKMYAEELRLGIAWVAFWREGRSWKSDCLFLNPDNETIQPDDLSSCVQVVKTDSRAVVLNGYYCGRLGENMTLGELAAGVRWHYENGYNALADFLEAHSGAGFVNAEEIGKQNQNRTDGVIDGGPLDPAIQPIVTVILSESDKLQDGRQMTLAEADSLFQQLDAAHGPGYDKIKFRLDFTFQGELDNYEGRQDFGDGDGGLIDHIESYHEYYANDEQWKNYVLHHDGPEALEQDAAHREMLLTEFIPYLRMHCALTRLEQAGIKQLETLRAFPEPDAIDQSCIAYYEAMQTYIDDCRHELNTAANGYCLPEMPKKQDFYTPELLAYQERIREEVRQEAAAAGMTVEEYAANDYEPRSSSQPEQSGQTAGQDDKPKDKPSVIKRLRADEKVPDKDMDGSAKRKEKNQPEKS